MKKAIELDIITTMKIAATLLCVAVIFIYIGGNTDSSVETIESRERTVSLENEPGSDKLGENSNVRMEGISELLKENGVSQENIDEVKKTASGATLMGDALPAKEYRTLADAEKVFGYYLGLHNKLESLQGYELVEIHIINNEFMQGTFERDKESIIVKTSKVKSAEEMAKVYTGMTTTTKQNISGVEVSLSGKDSSKVNVATFKVPNGKNYVISSVAGLTKEDVTSLLYELIMNLQSMDDWQE